MTTNNHHFKLGNFECIVILDHSESYPFDALFGQAPEDELEEAIRRYGVSRENVPFDFNVLLMRTGKEIVLFDAGYGDKNLLPRLAQEGIAPGDIDVLAITHADADHVNGLVDASGKFVFDNARVMMWQDAWNFWSDEKVMDKLPEVYQTARADFINVTIPLIEKRLTTVELEEEFLPGFRAINGHGHRFAQVAFEIYSEDAYMIHAADAIAHPFKVSYPDWPGGDMYQAEAVATRKALMARAVQKEALIFGGHLPFPGLGRVLPEGDSWQWHPV